MVKSLDDGVREYLGLPPYDDCSNFCCMDGFFLQSLYSMYGEDKVNECISKYRKMYKIY